MKKLLLFILIILNLSYIELKAQVKSCEDIIFPTVNSSLYQGIYFSDKKWADGKTISIYFINGSTYLRNKIMNFASEWTNYANVKFIVVNKPNADIRISFYKDKGSWSLIGINSYNFSVDIDNGNAIAGRGGPSMNFGWFNENTSDKEIKRVTLHEFGHALGLLHEHLNPIAGIKWNKPKVYAYYIQNMHWTKSMVDINIFQKYSVTQTNSEYDPNSIMHYPIDPEFTLDGYSVDINYDLSINDKRTITKLYPKLHNDNNLIENSKFNYRITNITYGDGVWALIMSKKNYNYSQSYIYRDYMPTDDEIYSKFNEGKYISDVTYGDGHWNIVMSDDEESFEQRFFAYLGPYPEKRVKELMSQNYSISKLVYGNKIWFVVMNRYPKDHSKFAYTQKLVKYKILPNDNEIKRLWKKGYRISQFIFEKENCYILYSKGFKVHDQAYKISRYFPKDEISEFWNTGFAITDLKYSNGFWYLLMSKNTGINEQSWVTRGKFPANEISELWDK